MQFYYCDSHDLNLPDGHRFPGEKYGMLRRYLIDNGIVKDTMLVQSELASIEDICRAHCPDYVQQIMDGSIDAKAMRRIGLPWSPQIPRRARATVGGALSAAKYALKNGLSGQLAGGTHHAHYDFGSGYCVFNDFAVAAMALLDEGLVNKIAIIDLDVHQGDGNAAILKGRDDVFILSVHGDKNFPFRKVPSSLDVGLEDEIEDGDYLRKLEQALFYVWAFKPDLILYQAGVDPLEADKLGRMALSLEGLKERDRMVLAGAKIRQIPISMGIGGGYADPITLSVEAYANTYRVAHEVFGW